MINLFISLVVGLGIVLSSTVLAKNPNMAVSKRDNNGDGKVSRNEWDKPEFIFNKIDLDGDGYLTAREFAIKWGMAVPEDNDSTNKVVRHLVSGKSTPIADVHFHARLFMSTSGLEQRMTKHNVKWAGGAGATGKRGRPGQKIDQQYLSSLGNKYVWVVGQNEINILAKKNGTSILEGGIGYSLQSALDKIDRGLGNGAKGIGEIHVNTSNSAPVEFLRRKLIADSPLMQSLWKLSIKHEVPIMIHMEFDDDSVDQLQSLVETDRNGIMVLGHCGKNSGAHQIREFLINNSNVYCNLAFRSPPQSYSANSDNIYNDSDLEEEWKDLIEEFPRRFMVGIDDIDSWSEYDEVADNIRDGLLANLTPDVAEMVAYKNAVRIYNLEN
ncbi:hypothetical protein MNB_SUP05-4-173 [hydrothermal vent metagenome]|uniref:EF-hand domain-containing protein n=1 Tax=hydrothermal vent metagenome TaxID=652676 RepID=A0A1W1D9L2_9ZZZZ